MNMKRMRYRKPSVRTLLGITRWKKRIKKALGITAVMRPFRALTNYKRRVLRRAGYYSPEMKMLRAAQRGQVPGPIGPLQIGTPDESGQEQNQHGLSGGKILLAGALASGLNKEHRQDKDHAGNASHLAEAMLLASALKGHHAGHDARTEQPFEHEGKARHTPAKLSEPEPQAHQFAGHNQHRGARLFGLLLAALLTALAIMLIWYFFLA